MRTLVALLVFVVSLHALPWEQFDLEKDIADLAMSGNESGDGDKLDGTPQPIPDCDDECAKKADPDNENEEQEELEVDSSKTCEKGWNLVSMAEHGSTCARQVKSDTADIEEGEAPKLSMTSGEVCACYTCWSYDRPEECQNYGHWSSTGCTNRETCQAWGDKSGAYKFEVHCK